MHKQLDTVLVIEEDESDIALSTGGKWKFFDDLKARIRKDASQGNTALGPLSRKVRWLLRKNSQPLVPGTAPVGERRR
jgi:hypothetical protein